MHGSWVESIELQLFNRRSASPPQNWLTWYCTTPPHSNHFTVVSTPSIRDLFLGLCLSLRVMCHHKPSVSKAFHLLPKPLTSNIVQAIILWRILLNSLVLFVSERGSERGLTLCHFRPPKTDSSNIGAAHSALQNPFHFIFVLFNTFVIRIRHSHKHCLCYFVCFDFTCYFAYFDFTYFLKKEANFVFMATKIFK